MTKRTVNGMSYRRLRVWEKAVELCRLCHREAVGDAELRRQAQNASKSVALNIAEGTGVRGAAQKRHYAIARGSAVEVAAAYEIANAIGESVPLEQVLELSNDIAAMLAGLLRS